MDSVVSATVAGKSVARRSASGPALFAGFAFYVSFVVFLFFFLFPVQVFAQSIPESFDDLARQAAAARGQNDVPAAIDLYARAVQLKPDWPDGWWSLGMLQYGAGSFSAARDALTHYIELAPEAGPAYAVRGLCEFEEGDYRQSLQDIQSGLKRGAANQARNESVLRYHEAILLTLNGEFEDALRAYGYFARAGVADPEMFVAIGLAGLQIPVLPKDLKPEWRDVALAAGSAAFHFMGGDAEKAQQEFRALFQRYPVTVNAHYLYGYLLFAKNPEQALPEFKRELEIAPANASAQVMLAWALLLQNDAAGALPYAEKAAAEAPTVPTTQLVLGRAQVETGNVNEGRKHLEAALKLDPDNLEVHLALVKAYSESGRTDDARRERMLCLSVTKDEAPIARP